MKICIVGDLHATFAQPANRKDNFKEAFAEKFEFIVETASKNECEVLILPGDVFDSPKVSHGVVERIIKSLRGCPHTSVFVVFGQHDQRYHSANDGNTPLDVLCAANSNVKKLHNMPEVCEGALIHFYGASWGNDIPTPYKSQLCKCVLVAHTMVIKDKLAWPGQTESQYSKADKFFDMGYDLVITGDNHQQFIVEQRGKFLFNMGSVTRSSIAQVNHEPALAMFDTNTWTYELIPIPIKPGEEIFKLTSVEKIKERNNSLEAFVDKLCAHPTESIDFKRNLTEFIAHNDLAPEVVEAVKAAFPEKYKMEV